MAALSEAFIIPINPENQDFVTHPYIPIQVKPENIRAKSINPHLLTTGRIIDIHCGTEDFRK